VKVTVKSFYGRETEVSFLFRGTTLYLERKVIPELFSQPEVVTACVVKEMVFKGKDYVHIDFAKASEKFLRPADLKVAVQLLNSILKA